MSECKHWRHDRADLGLCQWHRSDEGITEMKSLILPFGVSLELQAERVTSESCQNCPRFKEAA